MFLPTPPTPAPTQPETPGTTVETVGGTIVVNVTEEERKLRRFFSGLGYRFFIIFPYEKTADDKLK